MEKHRIQLDLTTAMRDRIDEIAERTNAASRAEVIRRSVSLYGLLVDEAAKGTTIELVPKGRKARRERIILA